MRRPLLRGLALASCVVAFGCGRRSNEASDTSYVPGLGEIMGLNQMRHAKLWFAGTAGNWDLASYEVDELEEGLDDAMHYHPTHKNIREPLTQLIPTHTKAPITALRGAILKRDRAAFESAFDALTSGCNACHQQTEFGFNVVQRPTMPPFSNQDFSPKPEAEPSR